jgi:hypothetical protein
MPPKTTHVFGSPEHMKELHEIKNTAIDHVLGICTLTLERSRNGEHVDVPAMFEQILAELDATDEYFDFGHVDHTHQQID